ncbi:hypothetical protein SAMN05421786_103126 [Chryseobacterium ureilyticum]|uniref:Uncharacterized protein n=1 Tax=Chryseobacterium ureilyticum TaxID=373668 RepID=A0A1N7N1U6_9FLAO|nr:hypothetical protein [Chryseobacterium ureilyticum]SIS92238.1 hypothetical protein SAMN05421786_103126 [Chryseobacterium ureilyticum]
MKPLTILEAGDLTGLVIMIVGIMILGALFFSIVITFIVKLIYESKDNRKFSRKQFIQTFVICLLAFGLISGYICG